MGTNLLCMNEDEFWKCTPKKLFALYDMYKIVKGIKDEKNEVGFIDDILF